ncbi:hypothetical protein ES705_08169 [subsurface metagenome]
MKTNKLALLLLLALLPVALLAHAPKKVIVTYEKESGKLMISIQHPVKDVTDHYIESIAIKVNGEDVKTLEYTSQSSKESHDVEVEMPDLKTGSKISLKASCNKLGAKSGSITIE